MNKLSNNKIAIFPLNDYYIAKKIIAKEKYNFSQKDKKLFAIELKENNNKIQYWDFNAFRPDPRDYIDFIYQLSSQKGCKIIVLYETIGQNNILIPRYIVWNSKMKNIGIVYFANIR